MSKLETQKLVANYMGAVAHALSGSAGRHREFIEKVEVVVSGSEPHGLQLMQFSERVRETGRPVMWIHHSAEEPGVPQIGLVARDAGKVHIIESCMLWAPPGRGRLQLVPDNFQMGSFRFDDDLVLRHIRKAPAKTFDAAVPAMRQAYALLRRIEIDQLERGDVFTLPVYAQRKLAA